MSIISVIYAVIAVISLLLAVGYCCMMKKKEIWLLLLYFSVFVVNCGYLCLSISKSIEEALLANRISYLGSAFLPLCMLMTIMSVCRIGHRKIAASVFLPISCIVFLIAASPGYSDCYYKSVSLNITDGLTTLVKEYGPLHKVYLIYLISYFAIMLCVIAYALLKNRIRSAANATIIASTVLGNIAVWGIEQVIDIEFEFLSISYVITELFLLMLYIMLQVQEHPAQPSAKIVNTDNGREETADETDVDPVDSVEEPTDEQDDEPVDAYKHFCESLPLLTITEKKIFDLYVSGKNTAETAQEVGIKENTLKFHNKNIYAKLGVSSRKQLLYYATLDESKKENEE